MTDAHSSWIKVTPYGGANTVTGSCYLVEATIYGKKRNYLVDCGLFSEKDKNKLNTNIAKIANSIEAVFVTHAHIDHIGRLPYLYKLGYRGKIYSTEPVKRLSKILLLDSANIQEREYLQVIQKLKVKNQSFINEMGIKPLYAVFDAEAVMELFSVVEKGREIAVDDYVKVCFYNAGHALGSASIMLTINNGHETYRLYFSGDIGQSNPLLKKRVDSYKKDVDFVFMESTYGSRSHPKRSESWRQLRELVANTILEGGNVIFPAFAVGRTQEILYLYYKDMMENDDWVTDVFKKTPVFVDSNMAVQATREYKKFIGEFKDNVKKLITNSKSTPFDFPQLTMIEEAKDSKELMTRDNYIVFSAAGMCNAGRVIYHLEKDLPNPKSAVIFTGYQAYGTLGRQIIDGATSVKIHSKDVPIKAKVASINGFSAHADSAGLIKWLGKIQSGYTLFLEHGEPEAQEVLKDKLIARGYFSEDKIELMELGKSYSLYKGGYQVREADVQKSENCHDETDITIDQKLCDLERMRNFLANTPTSALDSETIRILKALETRVELTITKTKKSKKKQAKPNKKNVVKQKCRR